MRQRVGQGQKNVVAYKMWGRDKMRDTLSFYETMPKFTVPTSFVYGKKRAKKLFVLFFNFCLGQSGDRRRGELAFLDSAVTPLPAENGHRLSPSFMWRFLFWCPRTWIRGLL